MRDRLMLRFPGRLFAVVLLLLSMPLGFAFWALAGDEPPPRRLAPAAWGGDHVGKPLPEYVTGDECLFCHRQIGPAWNENRHQQSLRRAEPDDAALAKLRLAPGGTEVAGEVQYLLGSTRATRILKRSDQFGKLDLLGALVTGAHGELENVESLAWDGKTFADRCAGCHTTAVDAKTKAFSALSLDCFACHGDVDLAHTKDTGRVLLSSKNRQPREVVSICGQCHLRGGKSKSSGLPYANTFVAGDNLFRDFQVELTDAAINRLPAIDRHIYSNTRDVVLLGKSHTTCLTCHDVHGQSSEKHQQLAAAAICASCHVPDSNNTQLQEAVRPANRMRDRSRVCQY